MRPRLMPLLLLLLLLLLAVQAGSRRHCLALVPANETLADAMRRVGGSAACASFDLVIESGARDEERLVLLDPSVSYSLSARDLQPQTSHPHDVSRYRVHLRSRLPHRVLADRVVMEGIWFAPAAGGDNGSKTEDDGFGSSKHHVPPSTFLTSDSRLARLEMWGCALAHYEAPVDLTVCEELSIVGSLLIGLRQPLVIRREHARRGAVDFSTAVVSYRPRHNDSVVSVD